MFPSLPEHIPWLLFLAGTVRCLTVWPYGVPWGTDKRRAWVCTRFAPCCAAVSLLCHLFLTRCPVLCLGCAGDFYHETNAGVPWQGKCRPADGIFSAASLVVGLLGALLGLAARFCVPEPAGARLPQLVWYAGSTSALRRCFLGTVLGLGMHPAFFAEHTATCAAPEPAGGSMKMVLISSFDNYDSFVDSVECIRTQQELYVKKHGYELLSPPECRKMWRDNQHLLPEMSSIVDARLSQGRFDMSCKLAAVLTTLSNRRDLDWVMWLDMDAVITNLDRRLEDFIPAGDVDFVLAMAAEAGGAMELPAGAWHGIYPFVPAWSTTSGFYNGGAFLAHNTEAARAVLRRALELVNSGADEDNDQRGLFDALRETPRRPLGALAGRGRDGGQVALTPGFAPVEYSVRGDVVHAPAATVRMLAPRCLNVHPSSWAPWNRWQPGDFVAHNWGGNKRLMLLGVCWDGAGGNRSSTRDLLELCAAASVLLGFGLGCFGRCAVQCCFGGGAPGNALRRRFARDPQKDTEAPAFACSDRDRADRGCRRPRDLQHLQHVV